MEQMRFDVESLEAYRQQREAEWLEQKGALEKALDASEVEATVLRAERDRFSDVVHRLEERVARDVDESVARNVQAEASVAAWSKRVQLVELEREEMSAARQVLADRLASCEAGMREKENEMRVAHAQLDEQRRIHAHNLHLQVNLPILTPHSSPILYNTY